jgi:transposase
MTCPGGPPRRERRKDGTGRKRGKQPGAPGVSMAWAEPGEVAGYRLAGACDGCGAYLAGPAELGVARSLQQLEVPLTRARRVRHDLHRARCGCGRVHVAARPQGVADSAVSIGPSLRALAVYLLVFQHVPAGRCAQLIAGVTGAEVSAGFARSCLAKAAAVIADVVRPISTLVTAAQVAGFDATTLRCGPAGSKKYVLAAVTERCSLFFPGRRTLDSFGEFGVLPAFTGIVVSGRNANYFHRGWEHIAGNQACLAHLTRDYEDAAESWPDAVWPVQAQRALRGLIRAWHAARNAGQPEIPAHIRDPLISEFRHAVLAGCSDVPRVPGPGHATAQHPGRDLLEFCRDRQADVTRFCCDSRIWPANNISERGASRQHPAEDLRAAHQRGHYPGPARHPQLHRHRPQARPQRYGRPAQRHDRDAVKPAGPSGPPDHNRRGSPADGADAALCQRRRTDEFHAGPPSDTRKHPEATKEISCDE